MTCTASWTVIPFLTRFAFARALLNALDAQPVSSKPMKTAMRYRFKFMFNYSWKVMERDLVLVTSA
jgi:hypothetical protein